MQLNGKVPIRGALTAITATLLGSGVVHADPKGKVESSVLLYSETNRVSAAEGVFSLTRFLKKDRILNARLTLDGLTGSSPNGATPSNNIQTFTRPSGSDSYKVKAGKTPLDDTFRDRRVGLDGSLTLPVNRLTKLILGAHLSAEQDYTSFGTSAGMTRDIFRKNTTLSASIAFSHDLVTPVAGAPTPLSDMAQPTRSNGEESEGGPSESKNIFDVVVGVTQVINRTTLLRVNYSVDHASGYLNDPYKIVSIVQGQSSAQPGEPTRYINESRPRNRTKRAAYAELRHYIGGHTIDLSYRYFNDSWGIRSQTVDFRYHLPLKVGHSIEPHFRWYHQTQANFYQSYLLDGAGLPNSVSADYRLAPFHAITAGLQYLFPFEEGTHLSLGVEYYQQFGDLSPPAAMGPLSQKNLFPELKAVMVRLGFSYDL